MPWESRTLIDRAIDATGLDDFGGNGWRVGFDRLLDVLKPMTFIGDMNARTEAGFVEALISRLKIEDWIKAHPKVVEAPVEKPVIIMGLPRTASSALQNNLASDPHWRFLRGWEAEKPVPPPVLGEEDRDPRFLVEKAFIDQDTTFKGKHIQTAGGPVEDSLLQRLNWHAPEQSVPAYPYTCWWRDQDPGETLAYQRRAMQLLQSRRPPDRWMLKSPWYIFYLDGLLKVFPDARLVMTHRHPAKIMPSLCSLLYTRYLLYLPPEKIDKQEIGRWAVEHWSIGIQRGLDFRKTNPSVDIYDIYHKGFNADPLGTLKGLYDWLGETMSAQGEAEMTAWAARHRRGAHGAHSYTLEEYGLSEDEIEDAFADYIREYADER